METKKIRRRLDQMNGQIPWRIAQGKSGGFVVTRQKNRYTVISAETFAPRPFPRTDTRLLAVDLPVTKAAAFIGDLTADEVTR